MHPDIPCFRLNSRKLSPTASGPACGSRVSLQRWSLRRSALCLSLVLLAAILSGGELHAASDTSSTAAPDRQWVRTAADLIRDGKTVDALARLREVNQPENADWHNLMGFAFRKQTPPDLERSEFHYASALKIKADHRGALEYYGELLLMKNDLAGAEAMLQRLSRACVFGCEEFRDLKGAIERYRKSK